MPLSRSQLDGLLRNCGDAGERLLVLLVRDLDGHQVSLEATSLSDFDRVSGMLRLPPVDGARSESVRLGQDTMKAFHEYVIRRKDNDPALFLNSEGKRLSEIQLRAMAGRLAHKAGLELGEGITFSAPRKTQRQRLVAKGVSKDLFYLYGIVSHPVRRQIVELLGDEGPIGFTQIKKRLDVRVGTLYYHFDMLAGLIHQDSEKRYVLTDAGKEAYRKLRSAEYVQSSDLLSQNMQTEQGPLERAFRLLAPNRLLVELQSRTRLAVLGAAFLLSLGAFAVYRAGLETVVLFVNPSAQDPFLLGLGFLLNWLVIYGVSDILATFVFGRKGEHLTLLVGAAYSLLPVLVFVGWWSLATAYSIHAFGLTTFGLSRVILLILQAWSLTLLARLVGVLKGLRLDKAAVIGLALAYLSIMIAYLRGV